MSEQTSSDTPSPWSSRAAGPPPRWYVYIAAFIVCAAVADALVEFLHGAMDALQGYDPRERPPPIWLGALTGVAAGAIWGGVFAWAIRLRLAFVAPVLAVFTALALAVNVLDVFDRTMLQSDGYAAYNAYVRWSSLLHEAAFWAVFLVLALIPRLRRRRSDSGP